MPLITLKDAQLKRMGRLVMMMEETFKVFETLKVLIPGMPEQTVPEFYSNNRY